jgi:hypothetical protein
MEKVLSTKLPPDNDAGVGTVKEYLRALLLEVWEKQESFNGKRPFGNSGWEKDLIYAVAGKDSLTTEETEHYRKLIKAAIRYLCL